MLKWTASTRKRRTSLSLRPQSTTAPPWGWARITGCIMRGGDSRANKANVGAASDNWGEDEEGLRGQQWPQQAMAKPALTDRLLRHLKKRDRVPCTVSRKVPSALWPRVRDVSSVHTVCGEIFLQSSFTVSHQGRTQ
jgi:hypothetical protein